jgi:hypothetical protein
MVRVLKGYSDEKIHRHYYPSHEEWQIVEHTSEEIKLNITGQAEILINRDEAEDLSRLLRHFSEHGTLPPPYRQQPSTVCN